MQDSLNALLTINIATFFAILGISYRVLRFINRMEFKLDVLWDDYEIRKNGRISHE
jgi:hypothetical protein